MTEPYQPIDCAVHDRLEDLAVRRVACRIEMAAAEGIREAAGVIVDVFARDGAEYLRLDSGETVRLDRIRRVRPAENPTAGFDLRNAG
jgi:Rho-binding antiterminator